MRPRTLALYSCLIVLTIALGALSLAFSTSLQSALPSKQNVTPTTEEQHGNLLVRAFYAGGAPVFNASVVVRDLSSRFLFPLTYHMDSSGELLLQEYPGEYGVAVFNGEFQTSATLKVSNGNTTLMDVSVNRTIRATLFNELRATGPSAFAAPWEQLVVVISANAVLYRPGDTVFIQKFLTFVILPRGNYSAVVFPGGSVPNNPEIKAGVVYSDLRIVKQTSFLWLTLKIDNFLSLDLWPGLQLVTYSASSRVSSLAG